LLLTTKTITAASASIKTTGMTTDIIITVSVATASTVRGVLVSTGNDEGILHLAATVTGLRLKILLGPSVPSKPIRRVSLSN
jgi:hypothetical protein